MRRFIYTLKDDKGRDYQGTVEAKGRKEAQAKLDTKGFYLTSLKRESTVKFQIFSKRISRMDVVIFSRQLATMMGAGLPIIKSLMALADQTDNVAFRMVINDMRAKIETGFKLSETMSRHPKVFSEFFISMVQVGETGGIQDEMLKRVSTYLEKEEELGRKIKSAFAYPAIVSVVAISVVTYLVIFVVPVFRSVYSSMRVNLPLPTMALIAISELFRKWWLFILVFVFVITSIFQKYRKTERGRYLEDKIKVSMPLFGTLNRKATISRFVRSFGSLISSGIPITKAMSVAERITANRVVTIAINRMRVAVNRGENIASAIKAGRIFPSVVVQMVGVGEESGALDEMLSKCASFLEDEVDMAIKRLTVKLEPILTFTLAIIVGFIALAIYLPMFDVIKQISH